MLEIKNLVSGYGQTPVLHNLNITISEGTITSLVGVNTAGKTTLVNTLCGLIPHWSGDIFYRKKKISYMKSFERARLGIVQVPEGRKLFPELTVKENLLVASSFSKAKKKRGELLEFVFTLFPRLYERKNQMSSTMSGGEQQMLAIGRSLMCRPDLLILDEPSLGLAPIIVQQIFEAVEKLKKQGMTIFLIEQNVKQSLEISEYAFVLEQGKIVLEDKGTELLQNPKTKEAYLGK